MLFRSDDYGTDQAIEQAKDYAAVIKNEADIAVEVARRAHNMNPAHPDTPDTDEDLKKMEEDPSVGGWTQGLYYPESDEKNKGQMDPEKLKKWGAVQIRLAYQIRTYKPLADAYEAWAKDVYGDGSKSLDDLKKEHIANQNARDVKQLELTLARENAASAEAENKVALENLNGLQQTLNEAEGRLANAETALKYAEKNLEANPSDPELQATYDKALAEYTNAQNRVDMLKPRVEDLKAHQESTQQEMEIGRASCRERV